MADPKPSTSDILAKIRGAKAAGAASAGESPPPAPPEVPAEPVAEATSAPAEPAAPAPPPPAPAGDKPKSTADIMAAIRNKGTGGAAAPAPAAPAAAGDKPKSTADILAAARAGAAPKPAGDKPAGTSNILASIRGGGAGKPAAAAPAAGAPAAQPAAAKAAPAAGDRPSVQEMLKAVKQAEAAETAAPGAVIATATPKVVKLPAKGAPAKKGEVTRRSVPAALFEAAMTPYYLGMGVLAAIGGIWSLAMARFMMPNTVLELPSKFKIGPTSDYPFGKVSEKFKASRGVWIVNTDFEGAPAIYALSSVCTHLGCTPSWLEAEQKFKCPCHGSGFYITGINFEGPAPRPLERVGLSVTPDGQLEVDKSRKFQEELGQWQDPKSFVRVV